MNDDVDAIRTPDLQTHKKWFAYPTRDFIVCHSDHYTTKVSRRSSSSGPTAIGSLAHLNLNVLRHHQNISRSYISILIIQATSRFPYAALSGLLELSELRGENCLLPLIDSTSFFPPVFSADSPTTPPAFRATFIYLLTE